jgi:hypothetical protein
VTAYPNILDTILSAPRALQLNWHVQPNGSWEPFASLDTGYFGWRDLYGVYVVASIDRVVRVGQGKIMPRLREHQNDAGICNPSFGFLWVTWADVGRMCVSGVERYLADELSPLIGDAFPDTHPIQVNLPAPLISGQERLIQAIMQQNRVRGLF